jgi:hypothetical protein
VELGDGSLIITFDDDRVERWTPARARRALVSWDRIPKSCASAGHRRAEPLTGDFSLNPAATTV